MNFFNFITKRSDVLKRIYLLADTYGSHISESSLQYCIDNNIDFIAIPEGATDLLQPLDDSIFGSMKVKLKSDIHKILIKYVLKNLDRDTGKLGKIEAPKPLTKKGSAVILEIIWRELPT